MKSSNMNARNAVSGSTEFPWKWNLSELEERPKHGHTVFSCFSCGGGSSMGYKLAGYDVVGNCEIDPDMMKVYKQNNHPKHSFLMDIRDFLKLPDDCSAYILSSCQNRFHSFPRHQIPQAYIP